jgi:hypothetical protein
VDIAGSKARLLAAILLYAENFGRRGPPRLLRRPFTASAAVEPLWLTYVKEDWFGVRAASEIKPDERVFTRTACF